MAKKLREIVENKTASHFHAQHLGGDQFQIKRISKIKAPRGPAGAEKHNIKKGDTVRSSDLDDLADMGHKVTEYRKKS